jgi:hypothetical protein
MYIVSLKLFSCEKYDTNTKSKQQNYYQSWKDPFNSSIVEAIIGESLVHIFPY